MSEKNSLVYFFGNGVCEGDPVRSDLLGGKGAGLSEMTRLEIPVPPGLTISTEACVYFYKNQFTYPKGLKESVYEKLKKVEKIAGSKFGDPKNPLLVSVRSGARVSMPGMMDTILNLGLNDQTVLGLIKKTKNPRFAYDSYRRFIQMYGDVVLEISHQKFEEKLQAIKNNSGVEEDTDLKAHDLETLILDYQTLVYEQTGKKFPQDPLIQLWGAVGAVFRSWNSKRARAYRKIHRIPNDWGTAVNIQAMVFGNMGMRCATGVAFTRNPSTGEKDIFGEYLINAQGEDVVAGIRTPKMLKSLKKEMPKAFEELCEISNRLETHFRDMQDIEFTIQNEKVWLLQSRSAKRSAKASIRVACDMVSEKLISKKKRF